jgi:hypothetical protein
MESISKSLSNITGFSGNVKEGNCFGEENTQNNGLLGPLDHYKKNMLLVLLSVILFSVGIYMIYGDETEGMLNDVFSQAQLWFGSVILGGYLSSAGELETSKTLDLDENVQVEINELLAL